MTFCYVVNYHYLRHVMMTIIKHNIITISGAMYEAMNNVIVYMIIR